MISACPVIFSNTWPRFHRGFFVPPPYSIVLMFQVGKGYSMPLSVEPPVCGSCRITMLWFNSIRTANTTNQLTHSFRCPSCNRTQDVMVLHAADIPVADDPAHWQKRADEIRQLAKKVSDAKERETLLKLAADYDKLADRAANRKQKPRPPSGTAA
jgi:hypothetical protein